MAPLQSKALESYRPVYTMVCADALADFTSKKALHGSPETAKEESEKVRDCFTKATSKVKDTPCLKLQGAYMDCLSSYSSLYCKDLASNLEECSAKHIGKLD